MASNKEDYGSFGKGIDKRGRPYYYLKNSKGGFGVTSIPEAKFKELLKKKIQQDRQEAKRIERELAKTKKQEAKKASKEEARLAIENAKISKVKAESFEKYLQEAKKKREAAGISSIKVSEKKQIRTKLDGLYADLSKDAIHVDKQYSDLMDNYNRLSQDKNYKVVSGRLLRLSTEYQKLDGEINNVLQSIKRAKQFDVKFQEQINKFLERIEVLDIRLNAVLIEVDKTVERVEKEKAARDLKAQQKRDAIDAKKKARDATKQSRDNAKAAKEKAKEDKKQNLQRRTATRARRLALVEQGRAKQEQDRIQIEEMKEAKLNALQQRQNNLAKFFDPSHSPTLATIGGIGNFGGKVLGGIGRGLGFDFSTEGKILSGLFKGAAGLGRFGLKGVHSLTQKVMGLDDNSIQDKVDNANPSSNSRIPTQNQTNSKSTPSNNSQSSSSGGKLFSIKQGLASISNKTSNLFSNVKSFFGGNKNSSNTTSNNINSIRNDKFQNTDFNRSDDNIDKGLVSPIVDLLEKILKELKKEGDEKKKSGMFGGLLAKTGIVGAGLVGGYLLGQYAADKIPDLVKKITPKNDPSKDEVEKFRKSIEQENDDEAHNYDPKDFSISINPEYMKKYSKTKIRNIDSTINKDFGDSTSNSSSFRNSSNTNINKDFGDSTSNSSSFRNSSNNSVIKAQVTKIEKIQDTKDNQDERMGRLQKWFSEVFIPKMADSIASSLSSKKGVGGSIMPPVSPF